MHVCFWQASNIDLILADNQPSAEVALGGSGRLIAEGVDLVIEYQIDEEAGELLIDKFKQANIPFIAEDIPLVGATYLGADHYRSGHMAGVALGRWLTAYWDGGFDHLVNLEEQRPCAIPASRIQGRLTGLQEIIGAVQSSRVIYLQRQQNRDQPGAHA